MALFKFRRQESEVKWPTATPAGVEAFKEFYDAETFQETLDSFKRVCIGANVSRGGRYSEFFPYLKAAYKDVLPYKYKEIWKILEKKAKQELYERNTIGHIERNRVLVVGAGPVGLRTAIEAQLLGARVVLIERRPSFTRNNVLKLWKFLIEDLKSLGAKKFFGKFATGSINHINIRSLQLMLVKISLMLGVIIYAPCKFVRLAEPSLTEEGALIAGWQAIFEEKEKEAEGYVFDIIIGASGKNCVLDGFSRYSLDARLAIAITANFVNRWSSEEAAVEEIGGLSRQYDQDFFKEMHQETGVDLENIVYYKDEVHYFVMTAKKESLLKEGVLIEDLQDDHDDPNGRGRILRPSNVNREKLLDYAKKAALYATEKKSTKLPHTDWKMLPRGDKGEPDCCIFDFTNLYAARVAARVTVRKGQPLLGAIVGDSLLEPFWPEG
ncbi:F-actin-monooxygenase MICAL2 [Eurytemora carolleeae]|uniref:F-actin-monooxygenase MICAL2 n=1 Tax=Eurytemora carolleeae TaxID=1294199 RepID=UPI000C7788E3|nr:F-actin-monooxygenase MICAL2 [Eurytemora carolleeae]|eukprot:XP_023328747.1 F-actin-monooxygenase MICAL2-like [Eurytemora affinis]